MENEITENKSEYNILLRDSNGDILDNVCCNVVFGTSFSKQEENIDINNVKAGNFIPFQEEFMSYEKQKSLPLQNDKEICRKQQAMRL